MADINSIPSPRLFATHFPLSTLGDNVVNLGCKIVYLCRNPKDNFTSIILCGTLQTRREKNGTQLAPIDRTLDYFCNGVSPFGPYWDHVLEYWNAHFQKPDQVLFTTYEEMKKDPLRNVMKIAEFLGCGFSEEEVKNDVCQWIVKLCSFEALVNMDATKHGKIKTSFGIMDNNSFYRRGVVGDWKNYLTAEMARKIDEVTEKRFRGFDIEF